MPDLSESSVGLGQRKPNNDSRLKRFLSRGVLKRIDLIRAFPAAVNFSDQPAVNVLDRHRDSSAVDSLGDASALGFHNTVLTKVEEALYIHTLGIGVTT